MLQLFQRTEINDILWNELITNSLQGYLYAYTWYLDIVSPNWKAIIEVQDQQYLAVMPVPVLNSFGIEYVKQPLFCQQLGIFSQPNYQINELNYVEKLCKEFSYIADYTWNYHNFSQNELQLFSPQNVNLCKPETLCTHLLSLQQTAEEIYAGYNADRKMNLKRALKSEVQIIESIDIEPLINLFITETSHKIIGGVHPQAYDFLRQIFAALQSRNQAKLYYTVNQKNEIEAGGLFAFDKQKIIYLFNAALHQYRKNNGRTLLINKVLQEYANKEYLYFDFESPAISPIAEFYESFGAKPYSFSQLHYNNLPFWVEIPKKIRRYLTQRTLF
jgi:hypothetical protein